MNASSSASTGTGTGQSQGQAQGASQNIAAPAGGQQGATNTKPQANQSGLGDGTAITGNHNEPSAEQNMTTEPAKERKRMKDFLKTVFPDKEYTSDEEAEDEGIRYIEDLHKYKDENSRVNKQLFDTFESQPIIVDMIRDVFDGADFEEAFALNLDPEKRKYLREVLLADDYTPKKPEWSKKKQEREAQFKQKEERAKLFDDNISFTTNELKAFADEHKLDNEKVSEFIDKANQILQDAFTGKITKDFFTILYKGLNFDKAVQTAQAQGETRARNEKISAIKEKQALTSDGLPNLQPSGDLGTDGDPVKGPEANLIQTIDQFNQKRRTLADLMQNP